MNSPPHERCTLLWSERGVLLCCGFPEVRAVGCPQRCPTPVAGHRAQPTPRCVVCSPGNHKPWEQCQSRAPVTQSPGWAAFWVWLGLEFRVPHAMRPLPLAWRSELGLAGSNQGRLVGRAQHLARSSLLLYSWGKVSSLQLAILLQREGEIGNITLLPGFAKST